jgi:hypothetical protein
VASLIIWIVCCCPPDDDVDDDDDDVVVVVVPVVAASLPVCSGDERGVAMTATLGKSFVVVDVAISSAAIGDAINNFPKVIPNDRVDNTFNHSFSIFGDLLK